VFIRELKTLSRTKELTNNKINLVFMDRFFTELSQVNKTLLQLIVKTNIYAMLLQHTWFNPSQETQK